MNKLNKKIQFINTFVLGAFILALFLSCVSFAMNITTEILLTIVLLSFCSLFGGYLATLELIRKHEEENEKE